ncbi:Hypothetical protein HP17_08591 [Helicobacter pylori NCTC 11637 = CCUG 17874 = ATCC 43504 = JCM 12093]|nr:Hypothetical protein HP17_08591 [Helicobacter pylori NCTC 11637 = CCUG 17874 = ATCC 43504 = JCM 12093]
MAWLETSNRFKDTPKISFKNASFKKRYSIKTLYNFLKKLLSEQPYLLKTSNTLTTSKTIRPVIDRWRTQT